MGVDGDWLASSGHLKYCSFWHFLSGFILQHFFFSISPCDFDASTMKASVSKAKWHVKGKVPKWDTTGSLPVNSLVIYFLAYFLKVLDTVVPACRHIFQSCVTFTWIKTYSCIFFKLHKYMDQIFYAFLSAVMHWSLSLSSIDRFWPFWSLSSLSSSPVSFTPQFSIQSFPFPLSFSPFPVSLLYWHVDLCANSSSYFLHFFVSFPHLCVQASFFYFSFPFPYLCLPPPCLFASYQHLFLSLSLSSMGWHLKRSAFSLPPPQSPLSAPPGYWLVHLIVLSPISVKLTFWTWQW